MNGAIMPAHVGTSDTVNNDNLRCTGRRQRLYIGPTQTAVGPRHQRSTPCNVHDPSESSDKPCSIANLIASRCNSLRSANRILESAGPQLRKPAINKQLCSCDVTCIVGGKEDDGLGDVIGCTESALMDPVRIKRRWSRLHFRLSQRHVPVLG
jgi:hypothetical protein